MNAENPSATPAVRYVVRPAEPSDVPSLMAMYDHSRRIMRAHGNTVQWVGGYPSSSLVEADVAAGRCYVVATPQGEPAGVFVLAEGDDPTDQPIDGAGWEQADRPYSTLHRLACAPGRRGVAEACLQWCDGAAATLRADTHADNAIMRRILERFGFQHRGTIFVADGTPRRAYQRLHPSVVCRRLVEHVERQVLPRYDAFDAAHRRSHALQVIDDSLTLARRYAVDLNEAYAAAAYHDVGLSVGRERHHLASGAAVRADAALLRWFSPAQVETIAQAAEDHRASAGARPRSLLGCIVAEADRHIVPHDIVRRTVQYGLAHEPSLDREGHWRRTLSHLEEKYGPQGYLQLLLPDSPSAAPLAELRGLIADRPRLRILFDTLFDDLRPQS